MKKRSLNYLLITVFAIAVAFTSCNKNDDENANGKVKLLKSMICYMGSDKELQTICFEYDNKNRITSITTDSLCAIDDRFFYQFMYSGNDLIKLIKGFHNPGTDFPYLYILDFSKNENKITVLEDEFSWGEIELTSNGYPITASNFFIRDTDSCTNSYTYQYLDGNLASISHLAFINNSQVSNQIKTFKYKNTKSPFYYCKIPQWTIYIDELHIPKFPMQLLLYRNNISEYKSSGSLWEDKVEYEYEYDDKGFVTKMYCNGKLWNKFIYY